MAKVKSKRKASDDGYEYGAGLTRVKAKRSSKKKKPEPSLRRELLVSTAWNALMLVAAFIFGVDAYLVYLILKG